MIGNFGDCEVFSFHATKFFNTLEGGAIVTNNDDLAKKVRLMKNFGFSGYDNVTYIGTNGKMNEVSAAMGITGLESLDDVISTNFQNYKTYRQELANIPGLKVIEYNEKEKNNFQYIIVEMDQSLTGIHRDEKGDKGDANDAVIKALADAGALIARGRLKHQYPHSWRSKKPVIFRNTPQWFIAMDKPVKGIPKSGNQTLRQLAVKAIDETEWVPQSGENRILGMVEGRPDWVVSRQRAWGVPITVFRHKETGEVIPSAKFAKSKELMAPHHAGVRRKRRRRVVRRGRQGALSRRPRR